tara:strand:+ start:322 stop:567 length:246 start_codon:yes stop_codon:yes gene_type:complete
MNEYVTHKALTLYVLGILISVFVWTSNAKSRLVQIDRNEENIEKINDIVVHIKEDMNANYLDITKSLSRIELLIKDKKDRE